MTSMHHSLRNINRSAISYGNADYAQKAYVAGIVNTSLYFRHVRAEYSKQAYFEFPNGILFFSSLLASSPSVNEPFVHLQEKAHVRSSC